MDTYASRNQPAGVGAIPNEASASAVSWASIFAGALVAAALTVTLVALGTGLGLTSVSPWANDGASAKTIGVATIIWLILTQLITSGIGGYLAGRLRTKWVNVHTDEVFFRDTAHGFIAWALGIVIGAAFLASAAAALLGKAADTAGTMAATAGGAAAAVAGASGGGASEGQFSYLADTLMRSGAPAGGSAATGAGTTAAAGAGTPSTSGGTASATGSGGDSSTARAEVGRILSNAMQKGSLPPADKTYLAGMVATRTGVSQAEAEQRVDQVVAQAKAAETEARQAADTARKAAAHASLWTFLAFLIGAFVASYAATIGGRQRDSIG